MRGVIASVLAVVLGVAAAWGAVKYEFPPSERAVPVLVARDGEAKVEVEGADNFDFGMMELGETKEHTFVIKNVGTGPLTLTKGTTSCKCTTSHLINGSLAPGDEREVVLEWTPSAATENFGQSAEIHTTDPTQTVVLLKISGRVRESFKVEPNTVALGQFSPAEANKLEVNVWSFRDQPWELQDVTYGDSETASFFHIEPRDMTPEEVNRLPGAFNGRVLIVSIDPGLPFGKLQQKLTIAHNFAGQKPIELHVGGRAVGDITILGRDYNVDRDVVDFGSVPQRTGKKTTVSLLVKGPQRDQVKLKIKSVDSETSLKAELGEPKNLAGKTISWPLTIEVPEGAETVNRLGTALGRYARIELETGLPKQPDFVVRLRLTITSDE